VRGEFPFLPRADARAFRTPQIPTTLPTLDELIGGMDEGKINASLVTESRRQALARPAGPIVHTVHTEVEGMSRAALFADLLDRLLAEGARFTRLDAVAERFPLAGASGGNGQSPAKLLPVCDVGDGTLPGRSGMLACQLVA
jgi:hypothetical protein